MSLVENKIISFLPSFLPQAPPESPKLTKCFFYFLILFLLIFFEFIFFENYNETFRLFFFFFFFSKFNSWFLISTLFPYVREWLELWSANCGQSIAPCAKWSGCADQKTFFFAPPSFVFLSPLIPTVVSYVLTSVSGSQAGSQIHITVIPTPPPP